MRIKHNLIKHNKHGSTNTVEYRILNDMKQRCYNNKNSRYSDWGGRGIKICDRWLENPANFIQDMGFRPSKRHAIDRINNDGNYEPSNCRWSSKKEQANNQRQRKDAVIFDGKSVSQWAKEFNCSTNAIYLRLRNYGTVFLKRNKNV